MSSMRVRVVRDREELGRDLFKFEGGNVENGSHDPQYFRPLSF
jgi:hypothetical protein